jgi:hypothetical protein
VPKPLPPTPKVFSLAVTDRRGKMLGYVSVEVRGFKLPADLEVALDTLVARLQGEAQALAAAYMVQARKRSARATAAQGRRHGTDRVRRRAAG